MDNIGQNHFFRKAVIDWLSSELANCRKDILEVGMLLGHVRSLDAYYSISNSYPMRSPRLTEQDGFRELIEITKSKIRSMETSQIVQDFLVKMLPVENIRAFKRHEYPQNNRGDVDY